MLARLMLVYIGNNRKKLSREVIKIKKSIRLITIKGIVIPVDWDEKGNATAVAISTHTEEEYLVSNDSKGKELLKFVRDRVEVTGPVMEVAGIKIIKVKNIAKCTLLNNTGKANDFAGKKQVIRSDLSNN